MKVETYKLEKLSDDKFNGNHPNGVYAGYKTKGIVSEMPKVGECFYIHTFRSSTVTEILKDGAFKTLNSSYKLTKL
jgi:hypothetical protein